MADYIKRESAINAIESLPTWWADDGGFYGGAKPPMVALLDPEDTISAIRNIPSADVAEVVGGEWKNKGNFEDLNPTNFEIYECSVCGRWLSVGEVSSDYFKSHYKHCPMCGARMDG